MTQTPEEIQASLAPPGAGIPFAHLLLGRYFLKPWVMRRTPWEVSEARFQRVHEQLKQELALFSEPLLTARVLIAPLQGLEDSSRYWSAVMCVRHLTIVGKKMEEVVVRLTHGEAITEVADTAKVKPEVERNDASCLQEYAEFGDSLIERLRSALGDRDSKATFKHPWFGPMRAQEWMALFSIHSRIHLEQIRAIRKGLC